MRFRNVFSLATTVAVLVLSSTASLAQTFPNLQGKPVLDAANVIDANTEATLNTRLFEYERTTGHQLAVVTVPSLQDYEIEEYANRLFRHLQLGDKDINDGVLLLLAPNERKLRIEVGVGLEPVLTDAEAKNILSTSVVPIMKQNRIGEALTSGAEAIMAKTDVDQAYVEELRSKQEAAALARRKDMVNGIMDFFSWVFGIAFAGLLGWGGWRIVTIPHRRRKREEAERARLKHEKEQALLQAEYEKQLRTKREAQRKRDQAQREREAADRKERARIQAEQMERSRAIAAAAAAALAAKLAAMSPTERAAYDREQREIEERNRVRQEQLRAEQRRREAEDRERRKRQEQADEERRRRRRQDEEDQRRRDSYSSWSSPSSSSSSSSYDSGSSFSGGGGTSDGGGSSSSY